MSCYSYWTQPGLVKIGYCQGDPRVKVPELNCVRSDETMTLSSDSFVDNLQPRVPVCLSVAAEGAAAEDQRGPGLYPEPVCSLSAAHLERQREAADENPHT